MRKSFSRHRALLALALTIIGVVGLVAIFATNLSALPEFSVRYNQNCQLCHHSPNGGGMRSLYGAQFFSYMDIPWKPESDLANLEKKVQPQINKNFQVGFDFRSIYYSTRGDYHDQYGNNYVSEGDNSFISMQGDLYLAFIPSEKLLLYLDKGLRGNFEAFALFQGLPGHFFMRAGHFVPGYGWRFAEHKAFVRDSLGFGLGGAEDGIEAGHYDMNGEFSMAITNGRPASIIDSDKAKALTLRTAGRIALGNLKLSVGGSYRYAEYGGELRNDSVLTRYAGVFGGVNLGRFTYLGEGDFIIRQDKGFVATQKLLVKLRPGWDLDFMYDYYDPDIDVQTGYVYRTRLANHFYLTVYLELIPSIEWNSIQGQEFGIGELQLHSWF